MDTSTQPDEKHAAFPRILNIGVSGMLVSFGDILSEPVNRAALAFRAHLVSESWDGIEETSTSLASVYVGFDPLHLSHAKLANDLRVLLSSKDWFASPLPRKRRLWHIPTIYGGEHGPQLAEAASLAEMTPEAAIDELSTQKVRVLTIGFAPGQPYLGTLPAQWDIPRQSGLTSKVPIGALVVAIRQFVLFTADTPTGWRHIGQSHFRGFRLESDTPFALRPGDEVIFNSIGPEEYANIGAQDQSGNGGAICEDIA